MSNTIGKEPPDFHFRPMTEADWPAVAAIYAEGIATGQATFETEVPGWDPWDRSHLVDGRLVAASGADVVGWAALSPVSSRCLYGGVAEVSIYVAAIARGHGVGTRLMGALVAASEAMGLWTLQASMFPENEASRRLHAAAGFREVGRRHRIGQHQGVWRDTVLMERRSAVVGA